MKVVRTCVVAFGVIVLVSAPIAGFLSGCRGSRHAPAAGELRVHLAGEPASADPSLFEDGLSLKILSNTVETLVGYGSDGKVEPRAASSAEVSRDGLSYRFKLKPGLAWSDGVPLTAQDFKTGLDRTLDPKTAAKLAPLLAAVSEVKVLDPRTLEVRLKSKTPYFLQVLGLPIAAAQRKDILEKNSGRWPITAPSAALYAITSRTLDREWVIEANPHRVSELPPDAPRVVRLVLVSDELTALALFEKGELDLVSRVPPLEVERLRGLGRVRTSPFWATYYVGFNTHRPALARASTRCALARAIRREEIVAALQGEETVAWSWIPPGLEGHFSKDALAASKPSVAGSASLALSGIFDSNPRNQIVMEKLQADWKPLGVKLSLANMDWKSFLKELKTGSSEVFRMGWLAAFADPISHLQVFTTGNPNNLTGWSSAAYDKLVAEVEALEPGALREKKAIEAQRLVLEQECVVVPIYHYVQVQGVGPRLKLVSDQAVANGMGITRWSLIRLR